MGIFDRLKKGLFKTKKSLVEDTAKLAKGRKVDDALLDEFEELLIMADIGPQAAADRTRSEVVVAAAQPQLRTVGGRPRECQRI